MLGNLDVVRSPACGTNAHQGVDRAAARHAVVVAVLEVGEGTAARAAATAPLRRSPRLDGLALGLTFGRRLRPVPPPEPHDPVIRRARPRVKAALLTIGHHPKACFGRALQWRRGWDSNPRERFPPLPAFQASLFSHSSTSPRGGHRTGASWLSSAATTDVTRWLCPGVRGIVWRPVAERVGFEPTRLSSTCFRDRRLQPLGHLSTRQYRSHVLTLNERAPAPPGA